METKTVFLIRHGQIRPNIMETVPAEDEPLTHFGARQAAMLGGRMARHRNCFPIETIVSSPLPRAAETAAAIAHGLGCRMEQCPLFAEWKFPARLVGRSLEHPDVVETFAFLNRAYGAELDVETEGETIATILRRAEAAEMWLLDRPEKCLAVVSHSAFLRVLSARMLLADAFTPEAFKRLEIDFPNTGVLKMRHGVTDRWDDPRAGWAICPSENAECSYLS